MKIGGCILILSCIYNIGLTFSFNEKYIEKRFFWITKKIMFKDIDSIIILNRKIIIQSNKNGFLNFSLSFFYQKNKKELFLKYLEQCNPSCKIKM